MPSQHRYLGDVQASSAEGAKRAAFEQGITRPFFLARPLGDDQLANWRAYLSFEEAISDNVVRAERVAERGRHR
jgi:hypothetical protein